jgi:hypothetical protein
MTGLRASMPFGEDVRRLADGMDRKSFPRRSAIRIVDREQPRRPVLHARAGARHTAFRRRREAARVTWPRVGSIRDAGGRYALCRRGGHSARFVQRPGVHARSQQHDWDDRGERRDPRVPRNREAMVVRRGVGFWGHDSAFLIAHAVRVRKATCVKTHLPTLCPPEYCEYVREHRHIVLVVEDYDRAVLRALEDRTGCSRPRGAAARLGVKRTTLQSLMNRLGIAKPT